MSACDEHLILVDEQGAVLTLYDDSLPDLGRRIIWRVSEIEPEFYGDGWSVYIRTTGERFTTKTKAEAYALEKKILQERLENG